MWYNHTMPLTEHVFGILFYLVEPVTISELCKICDTTSEDMQVALDSLGDSLAERGVRLLRTDTDKVQLVTAPELADTITNIKKNALSRDIGKAGAETLAVILYKGSATRAYIDSIRGVNSGSILRNLMMRGLVERGSEEQERGAYEYVVTPKLLAHLGVTDRGELSDFNDIVTRLETFTTDEIV